MLDIDPDKTFWNEGAKWTEFWQNFEQAKLQHETHFQDWQRTECGANFTKSPRRQGRAAEFVLHKRLPEIITNYQFPDMKRHKVVCVDTLGASLLPPIFSFRIRLLSLYHHQYTLVVPPSSRPRPVFQQSEPMANGAWVHVYGFLNGFANDTGHAWVNPLIIYFYPLTQFLTGKVAATMWWSGAYLTSRVPFLWTIKDGNHLGRFWFTHFLPHNEKLQCSQLCNSSFFLSSMEVRAINEYTTIDMCLMSVFKDCCWATTYIANSPEPVTCGVETLVCFRGVVGLQTSDVVMWWVCLMDSTIARWY